MSWANDAVKALQESGYTVTVHLPLLANGEYRLSKPFIVAKQLKAGERIPGNPNSLVEYDSSVVLTSVLPNLPPNVKSGGKISINSLHKIVEYDCTGEALKIVIGAKYDLLKEEKVVEAVKSGPQQHQ